MFDRTNRAPRLRGPRVLYHYTDWEAADSIIASQKFRATAHNCTNDPAELTSADPIILDSIRAAHARATGMIARVLRLFLKTYEHTRIGSSPQCYLTCFSQTRDDPHQWREYGARGSGVCLGFRLLEIPKPRLPALATTFMPVQYHEAEWRSKFDEWLELFVEVLSRGTDTPDNWRLAVETLTVTTTAWALTAKLPKWESEQEVRMIFLVREGETVHPIQETRPDGSLKRFITVPVTALRRMPVVEVIVGPNNDPVPGQERAVRILERAGYRAAASKVVVSAASIPDCGPPSALARQTDRRSVSS